MRNAQVSELVWGGGIPYSGEMFVITADQMSSRRRADMVPSGLQLLRQVNVVLPFDRTVGDELQGVLDSAEQALQATVLLASQRCWHIGIGVGPVEVLGTHTRESKGEAFVYARSAVETAKGSHPSLAIMGGNPEASDANALWRLLAALWDKRSPQGWEAVLAMMNAHVTQAEAAATLGISQQALSARLRSALWAPEVAVHPLACRLLTEAGSDE